MEICPSGSLLHLRNAASREERLRLDHSPQHEGTEYPEGGYENSGEKSSVMESGEDRGTEILCLLEDDAIEGGNEPRRESRGKA